MLYTFMYKSYFIIFKITRVLKDFFRISNTYALLIY